MKSKINTTKGQKVVLAYSGGLDTTYCVKYLAGELGLEVHTVLVDTGGFSKEELEAIQARAKVLGVKDHVNINAKQAFYEKVLRYLIFGNVLKNNIYPLSVSAERIVQAIEIANYAKNTGADYLAHGSTGAGNDQVRFDIVFNILTPEIDILTPIRDQKLTRQEEVEFLKKNGVDMKWEEAKYSINQGIWGTTIGGQETLTSSGTLPEAAYPNQVTGNGCRDLKISFKNGEPSGIEGEEMKPLAAIGKLNEIAGSFGLGRDIHVGDTVIGIKGRVGFEAPAAVCIIKAHHLLEKHVLTKWQLHWKEQLAGWYGMMLHEGQFLDPVMRNIEEFLLSTQNNVTGTVYMKLEPHRFEITGMESDFDLMDAKFGSYGEVNRAWTGEDVKGFSRIFSNQTKIYYQVNPLP